MHKASSIAFLLNIFCCCECAVINSAKPSSSGYKKIGYFLDNTNLSYHFSVQTLDNNNVPRVAGEYQSIDSKGAIQNVKYQRDADSYSFKVITSQVPPKGLLANRFGDIVDNEKFGNQLSERLLITLLGK